LFVLLFYISLLFHAVTTAVAMLAWKQVSRRQGWQSVGCVDTAFESQPPLTRHSGNRRSPASLFLMMTITYRPARGDWDRRCYSTISPLR